MGCCDSDSVQVSKMALELKSGPMLFHKKRFFGSNWRDVHSVLYNDSSLCWYKDMSREEQKGGVVLKDAPELIAFGTYTSQVPDRPPLPDNYEPKQMLAFGVRGKDVVYWFLCPNQEEVASWMAAIANTMPPPPGANQAPIPAGGQYYSNDLYQQQIPQQQLPQMPMSQQMPQLPMSQQMPQMAMSQQTSAPPYAPQQPPPQYTPSQQQIPSYIPQPPAGLPGQYPQPTSYRPPLYPGYNAVHPQPYPAGNAGATTVVLQQDRPGMLGGGGGGGGGGNFAMGMLLGGALGGTIGTAWGSHSAGGWGHRGSSNNNPDGNDTDVTINNYYNNDSNGVNNNLPPTEQTQAPQPIDQTPQPIEQAQAPQPIEQVQAPPILPPQETVPVENYVQMEEIGGYDGGYGGGYADDYGGDDFGGDFGGGDFGDF